MSMGHKKVNLSNVSESLWSSESFNENSNSSGSTSTGSWVDECEEFITKDLKEQYEKFEAALYSEGSLDDLPKSMQEEVKIWKEYKPHLRARGLQITPAERPLDLNEKDEEDIGENFEELIASHGSFEDSLDRTLSRSSDLKDIIENCTSPVEQESIKSELKEAIVDRLFQQAWPNVLKKAEPVLKTLAQSKSRYDKVDNLIHNFYKEVDDGKEKPNKETLNSSSETLELRLEKDTFDSSSSVHDWLATNRGYRQLNDYTYGSESLKLNQRSSHSSVPKCYQSRCSALSTRTSHRSAQPQRKKILIEPRKTYDKRSVVLPPIETLAIAPRKPDKRACSAMVRFTKTLPRIRPNSSKKDEMFLTPLKTKITNKENLTTGLNVPSRIDEIPLSKSSKSIEKKSSKSSNNNKWNY